MPQGGRWCDSTELPPPPPRQERCLAPAHTHTQRLAHSNGVKHVANVTWIQPVATKSKGFIHVKNFILLPFFSLLEARLICVLLAAVIRNSVCVGPLPVPVPAVDSVYQRFFVVARNKWCSSNTLIARKLFCLMSDGILCIAIVYTLWLWRWHGAGSQQSYIAIQRWFICLAD